jgi:hypothetical protein
VSRARRNAARWTRQVRIQTQAGNRQVARNLTDRYPVEVVSDSRAYVIIRGELYEERDRSGRLLWSIQTEHYAVPYRSWVRAVWTRPRPLPRALRAKLRGRR